MRSRTPRRDREMNWLLWEAPDTKMMLVKKTKAKTKAKRKAPRSPSTSKPSSPPLSCAEQSAIIHNIQQSYTTPVQAILALSAYEPPPPPYSHPPVPPKAPCQKGPLATVQPPALPPRSPPFEPEPPPKNPSSLKRSRNGLSCPNMPKLATKSVGKTGQDAKDVRLLNGKSLAPEGQAKGLEDLISSKLDVVLTSIDGESFSGNEQELNVYESTQSGIRGGWGFASRQVSQSANRAVTSTIIGTNYFKKAHLYMQSYPLLCLAAQYSQKAYAKPLGKEKEAHVDANWKRGTKSIVIKSVPIDDINTIIFAIRGSQTFMDWAVNLNSAPVPPVDFLDDPGNLCHSGFLITARRMIGPVYTRLRSLLQENPSRSASSLLITGHSAGGAIASLLYVHMLSKTAKSELTTLSHSFKRIHCLTFGTPPVSLLPLKKPEGDRCRKSLFLSFVNEGDPVPRADRAYIRSLVSLYASRAPGGVASTEKDLPVTPPPEDKHKCTFGGLLRGMGKRPKAKRTASTPAVLQPNHVWRVPSGTLSCAGRLVVLRGGEGAKRDQDVKAEVTCDEEMRGVVFGDPVMRELSPVHLLGAFRTHLTCSLLFLSFAVFG
ncbi:MAG: hypothetical protein Q9209_003072 [Squamulea sp. 1 TL-2023]